MSFLEVNTRLQVEHPVSEEVTGIDLVREQFRLAEGGVLDYDDPTPRGHSFEFRINGEDAGRGFLPAPGPVHVFKAPGGPGVRVDSGVQAGDEISGSFDSLLAKLIVTGSSREDALERSRRALAEFEVAGLPTVLPSTARSSTTPRSRPPTASRSRSTRRWIETEFDNTSSRGAARPRRCRRPAERATVVVEVQGKRIEVTLPAIVGGGAAARCVGRPVPPLPRVVAPRVRGRRRDGHAVTSPMQATVVKLAVEEGHRSSRATCVLVLEAMKMEQPVAAHRDGTVTGIDAAVGETVSSGHVLLEIA